MDVIFDVHCVTEIGFIYCTVQAFKHEVTELNSFQMAHVQTNTKADKAEYITARKKTDMFTNIKQAKYEIDRCVSQFTTELSISLFCNSG